MLVASLSAATASKIAARFLGKDAFHIQVNNSKRGSKSTSWISISVKFGTSAGAGGRGIPGFSLTLGKGAVSVIDLSAEKV